MAKDLAQNQIIHRVTNGNPLKSSVKMAIELLGYSIAPIREENRNDGVKRRGLCKLCPPGHQPKISNFCAVCNSPVCKEHFSIMCDNCMSVENVNVLNEVNENFD